MKVSYQLIDIQNNKDVISSTIDANGLFNLIKLILTKIPVDGNSEV